MATTNLGTAYIRIAPQMDGVKSTIQRTLNAAGASAGESFTNMFSTKSAALAGVVAGVASKITSAAMSAISSQIDNAIARVDTLNVFPKIMQNLGYETDESTKSLETLTARIEGLPTTLDEIVTWTQRLASSMDSLAYGEMNATDLAIAFNDAALSGGKGQAEANRAFEQYVQIIGRGRPMMQDWKIMLEVMPGQLKQMAKYLGQNSTSLQEYAKSVGKTVDKLDGMDLYEWISEDKNAYARERLAEFNEALVKLDKEGGAGVTAFKDQVGDATHTIGTAMRLIGVRISKALATVIQAFGAGDIYEAIDKFTQSFKGIGQWIADNVVPIIKDVVIPVFKNIITVIKNVFETISKNQAAKNALTMLLTAFIALKVATPIVTGIVTAFQSLNLASSALALTIGAVIAAATMALQIAENITTANEHLIHVEQEHNNQLVNIDNAQRQVNQANKIAAGLIDELNEKLKLQSDTEYQMLQAQETLEQRQSELNAMREQGLEGSRKYRMKELEVKAAQEALTDATNAHKEAIAEVNRVDKQRYDNMLTAVHRQNQLMNAQILEAKNYGDLAKRLDDMKNKTIEYQNAQGETIRLSKEEMADLSNWYAEELGKNDVTWKKIVEEAEKSGRSFADVAKEYGKQAGENLTGNFATTTKQYEPMITQASQEAVDAAAEAIKKEAKRQENDILTQFWNTGQLTIMSLDSGMQSKMQMLSDTMAGIGMKMPSVLKNMWQIHSPSKLFKNIGRQVDMGLIDGLDSYSDEIAQKAEEIANSVVDPFDKQAEINYSTANGTQSYARQPEYTQPSQVVQNNTFNQVADDLDVEEASKLLGWQVATAL